ncbi:hypothetical protein Ahy_B03g067062 [Arachis hypogaea]|uniref:Uncharacterized protein n=1 Tax=Arachis hypogaea TaxID=3818 RepID=A0A445A5V3_ARAHY|nr:hypothetical protein Ahy_B03g067062 [Arachis hypogaea]
MPPVVTIQVQLSLYSLQLLSQWLKALVHPYLIFFASPTLRAGHLPNSPHQNPKFSLQPFCRGAAAVRAVGASASSLVVRRSPSPCPRPPWILSNLEQLAAVSPLAVVSPGTVHVVVEDDKCCLFPVILFLFKSIQARFVNWHIANREIHDFSLFCPDSDAFWAHEPGAD